MEKPFYLVALRNGEMTVTLFGSLAHAKPDDKIEYRFTSVEAKRRFLGESN